ncbi:hypothetical protein BGZ95_002022 [Linnemannia exigua]|uniref:Uncharacterized protein n=1 Tax=Linnemannia exigua TaxID=604196 RepID=A0AAD4H4J8_9FUNG|nr:hypothetical protein BGZ95_002022 [Linnemannia exigua]
MTSQRTIRHHGYRRLHQDEVAQGIEEHGSTGTFRMIPTRLNEVLNCRVIYMSDIEEIIRPVLRIQMNDIEIPCLRNSDHELMDPPQILAYPDCILQVFKGDTVTSMDMNKTTSTEYGNTTSTESDKDSYANVTETTTTRTASATASETHSH